MASHQLDYTCNWLVGANTRGEVVTGNVERNTIVKHLLNQDNMFLKLSEQAAPQQFGTRSCKQLLPTGQVLLSDWVKEHQQYHTAVLSPSLEGPLEEDRQYCGQYGWLRAVLPGGMVAYTKKEDDEFFIDLYHVQGHAFSHSLQLKQPAKWSVHTSLTAHPTKHDSLVVVDRDMKMLDIFDMGEWQSRR